MILLDLTFPTPAENLACEEALLDAAESRGGPAVLRFWESSIPFVVLGYSNKLAEEVDDAACAARGIPILRRCSGGGTVVQGPGCMNYALVLPADPDGPCASVTGANDFIMRRHAAVLSALLGRPVTVEGFTDLAVGRMKCSGNAQRRRRRWLLFHGTFLHAFDLGLVTALLRPPPRQPDYREQRAHEAFLVQLELGPEKIKQAVAEAWGAQAGAVDIPIEAMTMLIRERYGNESWCRRR